MRPIKHFEEYIANGIAKKQSPDLSRANSLLKDSQKSYSFLNKLVKKFPANNENANTLIKLSYDIIMDMIRAKMLEIGFKASGQGAHEAEVSYMRVLRFNENDVQFCDQLRYCRNSIMYYGKIFDKEYANKVLNFLNKIYPQLKELPKLKKELKIPTKEECIKILKDNKVPNNIITHSTAVYDFSMKVCDVLDKRNIHTNRDLVGAAALLHDIKKLAPGEHEITGADYIKSLGFPEVANLIKKHGLKHSHENEFKPKTWEEKIIFYSDKRVLHDKVVSVDERFEYIKQRYKKENIEKEIELTKKIEKELLGNENK